jgi:hypothetical protein
MVAHEGFDMQMLADDISIITVKTPFEFNEFVQPIKMFGGMSLSINYDKSIKQKVIEFIDKLVVDKSINFDKS